MRIRVLIVGAIIVALAGGILANFKLCRLKFR